VWVLEGTGSDYNVVAGNFIGTTVSGDAPLPNGCPLLAIPFSLANRDKS
jgi:hypothetical protein